DADLSRLDAEPARAVQIIRDRLAQLGDARGRRVMRLAALDRSDAGRDDGPRRVEIRFADLEVNDAPALCLESTRASEDLECCLGAEPPHPARERAHEASLDLALDARGSFTGDGC